MKHVQHFSLLKALIDNQKSTTSFWRKISQKVADGSLKYEFRDFLEVKTMSTNHYLIFKLTNYALSQGQIQIANWIWSSWVVAFKKSARKILTTFNYSSLSIKNEMSGLMMRLTKENCLLLIINLVFTWLWG